MVFFADMTIESTPQVISSFHVPDPEGVFCRRGGRFGAHSSNESFTPIYYGRDSVRRLLQRRGSRRRPAN
jgi:hypothetical protein